MARWAFALAVLSAVCGCSKRPDSNASAVGSFGASARAPLRVAFSDWPGWTALEIGIQRHWFAEAGLDVEFSWYDYLPSLDAFSAGKVDAVTMTNGDALVTGANGARSKMILLFDYSNGNDEVIAQPGIEGFKDLSGKEVGLELTLVEHLLFLKACEKSAIKPSGIKLVNLATNETPQALSSRQVAAVAAWYPVSAQALRAVPGAKAVFTSADVPGLIYDVLAVNPTSLAQRRDDWIKFTRVWYRISDFVRDPKTQAEALAIVAGQAGVSIDQYATAMGGTHFLSLEEAKRNYVKRPGLDSIYGSTSVANDFNVANRAYEESQVVDEYIAPDIVDAL